MKVYSIKVSHIKKCIDVEFNFDETLVKVSGKNGAGKSTIIESIFLAIVGKTFIWRGKSIESIITHWYTNWSIECVLKDTNRTITVNRKINATWNIYLDVESSDGTKLTQKDLDALLSEFTIDPLEFTRLPMKEQYNIVKNVVWLDTSSIDKKIEDQFKISQDRRAVQSAIKKSVELMGEPVKPAEAKLNITELTARQNEINLWIQKVEAMERSKIDLDNKKQQIDLQIEEMQKKLDQLHTDRKSICASLADITMKLIDVVPRKQKWIEELEQISQNITQYEANQELWIEYNRRKDQSTQLVSAVQELQDSEVILEKHKEERKKLIRDTKIPIPFLAFTDNDWLEINWTPIDMLSSAEQIVLACRIATVRNPLLKVVYIKDASLLDEDSMKYLQQIAEEYDYQIFAERVGEEQWTIIMREWKIV